MLKAPEHQVAGHGAQDGALGPLVDGSGRFYKPLQKTERGMRELSFYSSISSDSRLPDHIRRFFPVFYGTQIVEASDGSGPLPHLVLEDVVAGLRRPSVMDIKVGSRTWEISGVEQAMTETYVFSETTRGRDVVDRTTVQIYGQFIMSPSRKKSKCSKSKVLTSHPTLDAFGGHLQF